MYYSMPTGFQCVRLSACLKGTLSFLRKYVLLSWDFLKEDCCFLSADICIASLPLNDILYTWNYKLCLSWQKNATILRRLSMSLSYSYWFLYTLLRGCLRGLDSKTHHHFQSWVFYCLRVQLPCMVKWYLSLSWLTKSLLRCVETAGVACQCVAQLGQCCFPRGYEAMSADTFSGCHI